MLWPVFILQLITLWTMILSQSENFGPYRLRWDKLESCRGPKQGECGKFIIGNTQNLTDLVFYLDFPKDCRVTKGRIRVSATQTDKPTNKLWNYVLDSPCQHFVLGSILIESFNLTNNCKIKKGKYNVHLDLKEKTKAFFGTNFFYGTYDFKIMTYNSVNNFFCVHTVLNFDRVSTIEKEN